MPLKPYLGLTGRSLIAGITLSCGMGFILFGFDNGLLGGLLTAPSFITQFNLNPTLQGTVTSLFEIGCCIGCLASSLSSDRFGRLAFIHVGTVVLCIGAVIQSASYSVAQLIVGRIVAGVGLGFITSNVTVWQSEVVPSHLRGFLVCSTLSFLIVGSLLAYWMDYGLANYTTEVSWRFPMAFQAFIALLMSIMLFFMPESPRWLLLHERDAEATSILKLLRRRNDSSDTMIAIEVLEIKEAIARESQTKSWADLLKKDEVHSRRRVILAVVIQSLQAFSGSTPINYYTTVIFQTSIGFSRHMALLMSGFLDIWFLVASLGTWYLIERAGRRWLFMWTAAGMAVVMAVFAAMLEVDTFASGVVSAVMLFVYVALFTWGWMGGCWVYPAEILPLEYRSKGMGLAVAAQWLWDFVMLEITPTGIANLGWRFYIIFAVFNAAFVPIVYFFFPETAGFDLEAVDLLFMDQENGPVKSANRLWKAKKSGAQLTTSQEIAAVMQQEKTSSPAPSVHNIDRVGEAGAAFTCSAQHC